MVPKGPETQKEAFDLAYAHGTNGGNPTSNLILQVGFYQPNTNTKSGNQNILLNDSFSFRKMVASNTAKRTEVSLKVYTIDIGA